MNFVLAVALVIGAALIAAALAASHRYTIAAHACTGNGGNCSRAWRVDEWTGKMMLCDYTPIGPGSLEPACTEPKWLSSTSP
jgi:hypothetical protein